MVVYSGSFVRRRVEDDGYGQEGNEVSAGRVVFVFRSQILVCPCLYFSFLIARYRQLLRKYASSKRYHSCVLEIEF